MWDILVFTKKIAIYVWNRGIMTTMADKRETRKLISAVDQNTHTDTSTALHI